MKVVWDDGGRPAGFSRNAGDCVVRAVAVVTGLPYQTVYDALEARQLDWYSTSRSSYARRARETGGVHPPRRGVPKAVWKAYLDELGFRKVVTKQVGSRKAVHLRDGELPMGRLLVQVSKHLVAVVDGVVHDTHDPTRGGTRMVYAYWVKP